MLHVSFFTSAAIFCPSRSNFLPSKLLILIQWLSIRSAIFQLKIRLNSKNVDEYCIYILSLFLGDNKF